MRQYHFPAFIHTCELPSWLSKQFGSCLIYHSKNSSLVNSPFARLSSIFLHWGHELVMKTSSRTFPVSSDMAATMPSPADHPLLLQEQSKLAAQSTILHFNSSSVQSGTSPTQRLNCFSSNTASFVLTSVSSFDAASSCFV